MHRRLLKLGCYLTDIQNIFFNLSLSDIGSQIELVERLTHSIKLLRTHRATHY